MNKTVEKERRWYEKAVKEVEERKRWLDERYKKRGLYLSNGMNLEEKSLEQVAKT